MHNQSKNIFLIILAFVMTVAIIGFLSLKKCSQKSKVTTEPSAQTAKESPPATTQETASKAASSETNTSAQTSHKEELQSPSETVENKQLPSPTEEAAPPLPEGGAAEVSQKFITSVVELDPVAASGYVNQSNVSYATIAALCMMFEDADYQLVKNRALRQMFLRSKGAGYLIRLEEATSKSRASFALTVKRKDKGAAWKITEVNLDALLSHYATQVSGADIHYSPLVKNPKGGELLAVYFELDAETITPRTQKQLKIVNELLKADANKNLVISGHTDALGSDDYNFELSKKRAQQVMKFFVQNGLNPNQVKIAGFGKNRPRQPNTKEDGADSPEGRRANRRAEILLDF